MFHFCSSVHPFFFFLSLIILLLTGDIQFDLMLVFTHLLYINYDVRKSEFNQAFSQLWLFLYFYLILFFTFLFIKESSRNDKNWLHIRGLQSQIISFYFRVKWTLLPSQGPGDKGLDKYETLFQTFPWRT